MLQYYLQTDEREDVRKSTDYNFAFSVSIWIVEVCLEEVWESWCLVSFSPSARTSVFRFSIRRGMGSANDIESRGGIRFTRSHAFSYVRKGDERERERERERLLPLPSSSRFSCFSLNSPTASLKSGIELSIKRIPRQWKGISRDSPISPAFFNEETLLNDEILFQINGAWSAFAKNAMWNFSFTLWMQRLANEIQSNEKKRRIV